MSLSELDRASKCRWILAVTASTCFYCAQFSFVVLAVEARKDECVFSCCSLRSRFILASFVPFPLVIYAVALLAPKSRQNQSTNLPKGMLTECSPHSHPQQHLHPHPHPRAQHAQERAVKQPKSRLNIMYRIRRWHLINIIVHVRQFFNNRSSVPAFD